MPRRPARGVERRVAGILAATVAASVAAAMAACAHAQHGTPPRALAGTARPDTAMTAPSPMFRAARPRGVSDDAMRIFDGAVVIDTHNDMPTKMLDDKYDPDVRHPAGFGPGQGNTDLPRLQESGLTAEWMSAWVDATYARQQPDGSFARVTRYLDAIHAWVGRHPDRLVFATTAAQVERAKADGKVAILIGVEGGHAIENSLDNLRTLYARGARYMTLTWNNGNDWAGSSIGVNGTRTGGLTPFGRDVVREMNRLGMLVDVSHVSDATMADVLATTTAPVIASHSSARALNEHPRNVTDAEIRAIAATGGVVNVNFFSRFIDPAYRRADDALDATMQRKRAELMRRGPLDTATLNAELAKERRPLEASLPVTPLLVLLDHIDHIAKVGGVDHVGIGSDFDGVTALPEGMEDVTALPRIAQGLLDRGYSAEDIRKILGGNMLRVMRKVLDHAGAAAAPASR
jgi:membrane dipeptidase